MCPPNDIPQLSDASAVIQNTPPGASTSLSSAEELQRELDKVPRSVLAHVVDVHCHPTDSEAKMTHHVVAEGLPIRICAMATRRSDQELVAGLARAHPDKVVPCFGYHPWFYHWISLTPAPSKESHYRALFLPSSPPPKPELVAAFERLLPYLPEPIPLSDLLQDVRSRLVQFPGAMLGEVGIDRVCRIPYSRPADPPYANCADHEDGSSRELSPFTIPLEHQLAILEAQLALAVELKRNVSLHSVKCQQATCELLDRMKTKHGAAWLRISVDLHSCGLSPQTWQQISVGRRPCEQCPSRAALEPPNRTLIVARIDLFEPSQKRHPNVFLSLSTAINARSPAHRALIAACAPDRILVESDFHDVRLSAPYTWHMLCTVAAVKGWRVEEVWDEDEAAVREEKWGAVRRLEENWKLFVRGEHEERVKRKDKRNRFIEEWEAEAEGE
ncbi:hypothetical protein BN946_scf185007.g150 [Trametes cinnabarina]|uniref:TatD DNase family Scn1 n=1 Tax=Pycnoporus cinnabarinus TaxID=5643 RepID=A0A060SFU6_PYCCI|nr:hypothetical protein BN946_scf185007.g150 [Trametes cinnabarina]